MLKVGFALSTKENEKRVALLPPDLKYVRNVDQLVFEKGYASALHYTDEQYLHAGARVADRMDVCSCPVVCCPRSMTNDEYFRERTTLFGWIHAVQGRGITNKLVANRMTAVAWEEMFEQGRHCFWRNNEISGEAAVAHAFIQWGRLPYESQVAVIGRGNVARGVFRALERYGCRVTVYDRKTSHLLRDDIGRYDVIVNAVLWDVFREDHLVYEQDLEKMKPGSMIIDISCDAHMGIESSRPTTMADPVYWHKGILHYSVDHTPALFFKSASESISEQVARFVDMLVEGKYDSVLNKATVIKDGRILDERIIRFQKR